MNRDSILTILSLLCALMLIFSGVSFAGTTVITVKTAAGGQVLDTVNSTENLNGAMFWNGTDWGVNDTYGHLYFTDKATGQKLKEFITSQASCATGDDVEILRAPMSAAEEYLAVSRQYTYAKDYEGVEYTFTACEIEISLVLSGTDTPSGPIVILRSRSAFATASVPYFDVYIENLDGSIEAFRGDPRWFHYDMTMEQALVQTDPTANMRGSLPTLNNNYWLDINGGSEMGGMTYKLITGGTTGAQLDPFATSFISQFAVQYTDSSAELRQLLFSPHVYSIEAAGQTQEARPIPSLSQWGAALLLLLFVLLGGWRSVRKQNA